ncbi:MAG: T9SS type A sorting domain-containing protein [Brumimicrobium sp.]
MKKIYFTIAIFMSLQTITEAQYSTASVNGNNIDASVNNGGVFFNDAAQSNSGYEYPKNSGNHLIYANSFWFLAGDTINDYQLAGQQYVLGDDLFPGALTTNGAAVLPNGMNPSKLIHQVSKSEIDDHISNYSTPGYTTPSSIADWPAHGEVNIGLDYYLAPFVDVNDNGVYDPKMGDYPKIRGDFATYMILNDKADVHQSGGSPLGIECHFMFYQYKSTDFLNNTTFVNIKVINRSTKDFPEFKVACFVDPDIGDSQDDFAGCDTTSNVMYAYNATNNDNEYGNNPPAVGVVNLNQSMNVFGYFGNYSNPTQMWEPNFVDDYYFNMKGCWKDAMQFTEGGNGYGGTTITKYLYSGNPNNAGEWSEVDEGSIPGERKIFMTTNQSLNAGEELCLDYAFVVGDGDDNLKNVNNLLTAATDAQSFYNDQENFVCENYEETLRNEKHKIIFANVYPNPSSGKITIDFKGNYDINIHSLDGRKVFEKTNVNGLETIFTTIESGSYILSIIQNGENHTKPIVIK